MQASTSIDEPAFSEVWNLFDILAILSDRELCESSLLLWLAEELLETQTIDGCRLVFDYLDSRRDRITTEHFEKKKLVILRACNELLRRLSRAEDTVFCGRVFGFMFQSFPLGDKSSVNLRGDFHTDNVTTYEEIPPRTEAKAEDAMEVTYQDGDVAPAKEEKPEAVALPESQQKTVKFEAKEQKIEEDVPDMDTLYPIFWSLQEKFSNPTRLFEDANLHTFKNGLEVTLRKFKKVQKELEGRGVSKLQEDRQRGVKRKRNGQADELASSYNPKYLTSRDLFDLEVSDIAFQRHVVVQALITVDFLLSQTPKAKKKIESLHNKSVKYKFTLSEEDTKWATALRAAIAQFLQEGPEGKFYYRMVDTVLSRDKNWVYWKAEGCPPILREPVSAEDFAEAEKGAQKACANKRIRPMPMGSLDLTFLSDGENDDGMEQLKDPGRYSQPKLESFERPLADDDFEIEMAKNDGEKQLAIDARASRLWRTLRIASKSKLNVFDKIDDGNNLKPLFEPEREEKSEQTETNGSDENADPSVSI